MAKVIVVLLYYSYFLTIFVEITTIHPIPMQIIATTWPEQREACELIVPSPARSVSSG